MGVVKSGGKLSPSLEFPLAGTSMRYNIHEKGVDLYNNMAQTIGKESPVSEIVPLSLTPSLLRSLSYTLIVAPCLC